MKNRNSRHTILGSRGVGSINSKGVTRRKILAKLQRGETLTPKQQRIWDKMNSKVPGGEK